MTSTTCKHPQFINLRCFCCNKTKKECGSPPTTPFEYFLPRLCLSHDEINRLRNIDLRSLIDRKKLHLILDLDNTLIHTTKLNKLTTEDKTYIGVTQKGKGLGDAFIHEMTDDIHVTKKRPGTIAFLQQLSSIFDISIYTMGCRSYAKWIAKLLDPEKKIFKFVISREDCTSPGLKGLDVVLSHERVVLIVDDSSSVWSRHSSNLLQIAPYRFFSGRESAVEKRVKDECVCSGSMDGELARVLTVLRSVHTAFYDENSGNIEGKDAREILKSVIKAEKPEDRAVDTITGQKETTWNNLVRAMQEAKVLDR